MKTTKCFDCKKVRLCKVFFWSPESPIVYLCRRCAVDNNGKIWGEGRSYGVP